MEKSFIFRLYESGNESEKEIIITHPLPWLSPNVQQFKKSLDEAS
jgi:hypothetical protein